jgi:serine/threonine protein kinase
MNGTYVGRLSADDPLHGFLARVARDHMGVHEYDHSYRVFRLSGSHEVYCYEGRTTSTRIIGKFFGPRFGWDRDRAAWMASREYDSLQRLRGYGLCGSPHHVVRPLAVDREINSVLVMEYYEGEQFSHAIDRALAGDDGHLFWRLRALAYYLATQHNRTANGATVDFGADCTYLDHLAGMLQARGRIGQWDVDEFSWLGDLWRERPRMWQDRQVWLHGDATPANFLFGHGLDVAAIDLERCKRGDRMFDVGRVAGELQHAFLSATGDWRRAEGFIGHFLWEYSCHFPDRGATFGSVSSRLPYYMALNLLRIARNDYISPDYGATLVDRAKTLLRSC